MAFTAFGIKMILGMLNEVENLVDRSTRCHIVAVVHNGKIVIAHRYFSGI